MEQSNTYTYVFIIVITKIHVIPRGGWCSNGTIPCILLNI